LLDFKYRTVFDWSKLDPWNWQIGLTHRGISKLNRNDLNPSFGVNMDQGSHKWDDVGDDTRKTLVTDMGFMA
jgi:hypothetical protein